MYGNLKWLWLFFALCFLTACENGKKIDSQGTIAEQWTKEKAWEWQNNNPWLVGTNFNPSSSINQLEFWQEETFDLETIKRELAWSAELGMNMHRVYLHNLLWEQDSVGFLNRLDKYLEVSDNLGIKTMFVLLDDVWHPVPKLGRQPEPVPHVHNSGWVQAPGAEILGDSSRHSELESYIKGTITKFAKDERVLYWDLYNEPDNVALQEDRNPFEPKDKYIYSLSLMKKVFHWAREVNPSQPLTVGFWKGDPSHWGTPDSLPAIDRYAAQHSDVISFHAYDDDMAIIEQKISELKKYGRPLLCTEYLARARDNTFQNVLPIFKREQIAAINWGFVSGKTNTIYPWSSWSTNFTEEPKVWHHDILRADGRPYSEEEVSFIKEMIQ